MYKKTILSISATLFLLIAACTSETQPTTEECTDVLEVTFENQLNSNCGLTDGGFTVNVTGGNGDYTYQLGNNAAQSGPVFENLAAGPYTVTVRSSDGCMASANVSVLNSDGVNATLATTPSDCDNPTGSIVVTATDGEGPYEYRLNDGAFQSEATFSALSPGDYNVTVRDTNGCEIDLTADVSSDVIFADIKNIVSLNCATSGCHDGTISPNFTSDATIVGRASRIQARTSSRTMPPSGRPPLSDQEIADIICWVNDGAAGN